MRVDPALVVEDPDYEKVRNIAKHIGKFPPKEDEAGVIALEMLNEAIDEIAQKAFLEGRRYERDCFKLESRP